MNNSEHSDGLTKQRHVESKSRPDLIAKLAFAQLIVTLIVGLLVWGLIDARNAISALFGGGVVVMANLYMAARMFFRSGSLEPEEMLARFYASVVLKGVFTLAMMVIFMIFIKVSIAPFILAYLLVAVVVNIVFLLVPTNDVVIREDHEAHHEKI